MTQRIFDKDNKKDMDDLWDILPEETAKIKGGNNQPSYLFDSNDKAFDSISQNVIKINWHDATEITRPVNYIDMLGCVGWFSNKKEDKKYCFGIFDLYDDKDKSNDGKNFHCKLIGWYSYFTPAKKSELKFWGEAKDE